MADKYDDAIAYLTEHPEEIFENWLAGYCGDNQSKRAPAACLFKGTGRIPSDPNCGCLTMVRSGSSAQTRALTEAIQNDNRIPQCEMQITVAHLPVFAEWQRRLDKELNRA